MKGIARPIWIIKRGLIYLLESEFSSSDGGIFTVVSESRRPRYSIASAAVAIFNWLAGPIALTGYWVGDLQVLTGGR